MKLIFLHLKDLHITVYCVLSHGVPDQQSALYFIIIFIGVGGGLVCVLSPRCFSHLGGHYQDALGNQLFVFLYLRKRILLPNALS
jgi:hypothetical protein